MIGMRNRITHAYEAIYVNIVWDTIKNDVPQLPTELRQLLQHIDE